MRSTSIVVSVCTVAVAAALTARPAFAGPPLVCFPFDIGHARSLPILDRGYGAPDPKYDLSRLVPDTLELLDPKAPVIVHMETIRRAALYAKDNAKAGEMLLTAIEKRAATPGADAPVNVFDLGYLVETYRQAGVALPSNVDGYVWVQKAIALKTDPQMEFAAAIISAWPRRADHAEHVRLATAAAPKDELLGRNLSGHLPGTEQR